MEAARKAGVQKEKRHRLGKRLAWVLMGEAAVLGAGSWAGRGAEFSFIRLQEHYQAEWAVPESFQENEAGSWDIYGVRFDWTQMEIQFYHQTREMPQP